MTDTLIKKLRRVRIPLHCVWGEHDVTAVPSEVAPMIVDGQTERTWSVIPNGGHWIQYECAEAFNALMLQWFGLPSDEPHAKDRVYAQLPA